LEENILHWISSWEENILQKFEENILHWISSLEENILQVTIMLR
jgi:hypothetical protein